MQHVVAGIQKTDRSQMLWITFMNGELSVIVSRKLTKIINGRFVNSVEPIARAIYFHVICC